MHSHVDMITHGMAIVEPVDGTCWSKLMTHSQQVNCQHGQSKEKTAGMNHQSSDHTVPTLQGKTIQVRFKEFARPKLLFFQTQVVICLQSGKQN